MSDTSSLSEHKISRSIAIGLPLVTTFAAIVCGSVLGPAMAILVLAAGVMLGVVALLWNSLRVLSGDAGLPPELEAMEAAARGIDALSSRKKMLLRALKDLDNERALGKLDDEDHADIASSYREELKEVLRRIDESLAPHREKAEALARTHLTKSGLADAGYRGELPAKEPAPDPPPEVSSPQRKECAKCAVSNEPDAKFCKGCGAALDEAAT